jgi:hypothetical protein
MTASASVLARAAAIRLGRDEENSFRRRMPSRRAEPAAVGVSRDEPASGVSGSRYLRVALAAAALAIAGLALAAQARSWLAFGDHSADRGRREIVIGNDVAWAPGNHIRFGAQRRNGALERLDLHFHWPDMAGYGQGSDDAFDSGGRDEFIVYVTLEPRAMRLDMSGRIGPIYAKFFEGPEVDAGNGLRRRGLAAAQGFVGEDFYYEAASPWPFAARCVRAEAGAPWCLRDIHAGKDLSVTYRFHQARIGEWMALDAAVRGFVNDMLAR